MRTLVETVLLYGSKTWSFSTRLEKRVDRCYKNPLRRAQNFSQKDHAMLERVYGGLTTIFETQTKASPVYWSLLSRNNLISHLGCPMGKVRSHKLKYPKVIVRYSGRLDMRDLSESWCLGRNLQEYAVLSGS